MKTLKSLCRSTCLKPNEFRIPVLNNDHYGTQNWITGI